MTTCDGDLDGTYICEITENNMFIEETGNITVYGINMYNRDSNIAKLDGEHCRIDDISYDIEKVRLLCELIVKCDVFPVHLRDIVEDMLC